MLRIDFNKNMCYNFVEKEVRFCPKAIYRNTGERFFKEFVEFVNAKSDELFEEV